MKFSNFKTIKKLEEDGVWVPFGEGFEVKLARFGNSQCQTMIRKMRKPHLRQIRRGTLDEDVINEIARKAIAKHVLLDWKGLEDEDGANIEFSKAKAYELLGTRDFYDEILDMSSDMSLFQQEDQEQAVKNSPTSLNGS